MSEEKKCCTFNRKCFVYLVIGLIVGAMAISYWNCPDRKGSCSTVERECVKNK